MCVCVCTYVNNICLRKYLKMLVCLQASLRNDHVKGSVFVCSCWYSEVGYQFPKPQQSHGSGTSLVPQSWDALLFVDCFIFPLEVIAGSAGDCLSEQLQCPSRLWKFLFGFFNQKGKQHRTITVIFPLCCTGGQINCYIMNMSFNRLNN